MLEIKEEHYGVLFSRINRSMEEKIVNFCQTQKIALPGTPSRWTKYGIPSSPISYLLGDHVIEDDKDNVGLHNVIDSILEYFPIEDPTVV